MARGITKLGLAVTAGVLVALTATGPAGAAPSAATANAGGASKSAAASHPAPVAKNGSPAASKLGRAPGGARTAHLDGVCNAYADGTGDLCLWYFQNYTGSYVDIYFADATLWDNVFLSPGSGQGAVVANNSESDWNYDSTYSAWVCTDINFGGVCAPIPPNSGGNFNDTFRNNVESVYWGS